MATFDDHIKQARNNLRFLACINQNCEPHYDWQVTVCFYTALHFINAHLATHSLQYRKHIDVKDALNPHAQMSLVKLPEDEYVAYAALQSLSRRARYLVNEKDRQLGSTAAASTYEKHLKKALVHLETLTAYFMDKYQFSLPDVSIRCVGFRAQKAPFVLGA